MTNAREGKRMEDKWFENEKPIKKFSSRAGLFPLLVHANKYGIFDPINRDRFFLSPRKRTL